MPLSGHLISLCVLFKRSRLPSGDVSVAAGVPVQELPASSAHSVYQGHNRPTTLQHSMAPASPLSTGHRLSASEASVPLRSSPPPCLKLPTPAEDPPPRSPLLRKLSPSVLSSASLLCSRLAAAPQVSSEPAPPRTSSPRYELAAIAFLSAVPLRPKDGSQPRIYPRRLPYAVYRPCSPLSCKVAARTSCVSGPGSIPTPRNVLPPSTSSAQNPCNSDRRTNRFTVTRGSPQVASPVPRKCGSFPPPCLAAPNATLVHVYDPEGNSIHSRTHTSPYSRSPTNREKLPAYAFNVADSPLTGKLEGDSRTGDHSVRSGLDRRSCCTRWDVIPGAKSSTFSSSSEKWDGIVCSATLEAYGESSAAPPLREEGNPSILQHTAAGEGQDVLLKKSSQGGSTNCPCDWILRQTSTSQVSSVPWQEKKSEELQLPLRLADDNARDNAQTAAVASFPSNTCLSRPSVDSSDPYLPLPQRTYCTNCTKCAVKCSLPGSADGESLVSPLSETKRLLPHFGGHPAIQKMRHPRRRHYPGGRGTDTEAQRNVTQLVHGVCRRPSSFTLPKFSSTSSARGHIGRLSLPTLQTHSSGNEAVVASLLRNEAAQSSGAPRSLVPQKTDSSEAKIQPFIVHPSAKLHPQHGSAEPFPTNVVARRLVSAAAETSPLGGPMYATCQESDSKSAAPAITYQALSLTNVAAAGMEEERNTLVDVGAQAAVASTVTGTGIDAFLAPLSILDIIRAGPRKNSRNMPNGAQQVRSAGQMRQNGVHECCGVAKDEAGGDFGAPGLASIHECSTKLSLGLLERKSGGEDCADKAVVSEVVDAYSEEVLLFSELQRTLRELQVHGKALSASDIVFDTIARQELCSLGGPAGRTAEKSRNAYKGKNPLLTSRVPCPGQALHYCVLEEGSFGKVFVGRFLKKLPTGGVRRWWRTLPLCERFLEAAGCPFPWPATDFLPPQAQNAIENNVKVAIKVPVEAMMLRDPVGVLARTLNEWKILAVVHAKRKMLFPVGCQREGDLEASGVMTNAGTTRSGKPKRRKEARDDSSCGDFREAAPSIFCQEQVSDHRVSSCGFARWHPMHPQAEPPGVVELVGGVIHGPLDVWLVTRLAAGKDLYTRKYSRSLADRISIPPAAGLAMCRQLAAIVDFLHARAKRTPRQQCAAVASFHNHRLRTVECPSGDILKCGECQKSDDDKAAPDKCVELFPGGDFCCSVSEAPVIVHRDIKPENIIVDDNWRIQLCDFGDAEASPDGTVSRVSGATWLYAPVELLCAAPLKSSTDVQDVFPREHGRRLGAHSPCTHTNDTRCGGRARSCPPREDVENQWPENCVCMYGSVDAVLTEKWDIWSMGCVFQEMFGLPNPMSPYVSPTDPPQIVYEKLKQRACSGRLVPVVAPEIQGIARQIIFACLRSDPQARPSATAVLRMWSAPEEEILKDIRLSVPRPTQPHSAGFVGSTTDAATVSVTPGEVCAGPPVIDSKTCMLGREQHRQTSDTGRQLYIQTACSSERKVHCGERDGGGTATGKRVDRESEVYIVPNLAIVPNRCIPGVKFTGLTA